MKPFSVLIACLALAALLTGCTSPSAGGGGSEGDQAAAESYKSPNAVPPPPGATAEAPVADPTTGTGSSGIRAVPPNAAGDRN